MKRCHKCATPWEKDAPRPGYQETCPNCLAYLHVCKNCRFHAPKAHNQCRMPGTEMVRDPAGMNYCDEFRFHETATETAANNGPDRDALAQLFGGATDQDDTQATRDKLLGDHKPEPDPRQAFDDLFGNG